MQSLHNIECFTLTAELGSFSAAARRLGLTPAAVGKSVAKLESSIGVRLFNRSTRRLTLTEAGERFLVEVSDGLSTIRHALANLADANGHPSGTLRVSMAPAFGRHYVVPLLAKFLARFPAIVPDFHFDNRPVDLIGEGYDAAIGGGIELPQGAVAKTLAPAHRILVAAPAYLERHAGIHTPEDLLACDGLFVRPPQTGRIRSLPLQDAAGRQAPARMRATVVMSDPEAICAAAELGLGVALTSIPQALPYLERGSLVRVLPSWHVDAGSIAVYYPARALLPAKTRAFVAFLAEEFEHQGLARRLSAQAIP